MNGRNVLFKVGCEAGTYIRKLCYDIGEVLAPYTNYPTYTHGGKKPTTKPSLKNSFTPWKKR